MALAEGEEVIEKEAPNGVFKQRATKRQKREKGGAIDTERDRGIKEERKKKRASECRF